MKTRNFEKERMMIMKEIYCAIYHGVVTKGTIGCKPNPHPNPFPSDGRGDQSGPVALETFNIQLPTLDSQSRVPSERAPYLLHSMLNVECSIFPIIALLDFWRTPAKVRASLLGVFLFCILHFAFCISSRGQTEPNPIRLLCDIYNRANTIDLNTGQPAQFYRGDDIEIDIGVGTNGALYTNTIVNYSNIVCSVFRAQNDTNSPMMQAVAYATNFNTGLTAAQWTNNAAPFYHAAFLFTGTQTAIPLSGNSSASYWLRIDALTTNNPTRTLTLEDGPITVFDGPISSLAPPIATGQSYLTVSNSLGTLLTPTNFFAANSNLLNQAIPPSTFSGVALTNYANALSQNNTNFTQGLGTNITNFFQWGAV